MNNTLVTLTLVLLLDSREQPDLLLQRGSNPAARSETAVPPDVIPKVARQ